MIRCEKKTTGLEIEIHGMGGVILSELEIIVRQLKDSVPKEVILEAVNDGLEKEPIKDSSDIRAERLEEMQRLADDLTRSVINDPDMPEEAKQHVKDMYKKSFGREFKDEEQKD